MEHLCRHARREKMRSRVEREAQLGTSRHIDMDRSEE